MKLSPYILLSIALGCALLHGQTLDELFQSSATELEAENAPAAISSLNEFISQAKEKNIRSSEAHHNLAASYAREGDLVSAAKELVESTDSLRLPFSRLKELGFLKEVQRQLGIQHSPLESIYSLFLLGISRELLVLLAMIALWSLVGFHYFRLTRRKTYKFLPVIFFATFAIIGMILLQLKQYGSLGLLTASNEVKIYAGSNLDGEIISLPPGTLVRVRRTKDSAYQILEPIYGWVKSEECQLLNLPVSVGL